MLTILSGSVEFPFMRMERRTLVSKNQPQVFHVISRVVDRRFIFGEREKGVFLGLMRQFESFSGIEILSYCLMGNHFHLLLRIPVRPGEISVEEVRKRMEFIYSEKKMALIDAEISQKKQSGYSEFEEQFYHRQRDRMYDLSAFIRDLKLKFTKWYNKTNERKGTLWEERFKSLLVEGKEGAMMRVASYIELNPVRAGIVEEPHQYRWCSYTEALAGGKKARLGIMKLAGGIAELDNWDIASAKYRESYLIRGAEQVDQRKGFSIDKLDQIRKEGGKLSHSEIWKTRLRYFTDGVVLGSQSFIETFTNRNKESLLRKGRRKSYLMDKLEGIYTYRQVR